MPRPVRIDDLYRLVLPGSPVLSPDGERVAFAVKRVNRAENRYVSHLWLVAARGGRPRRLTRGVVLDASPAWSPEGRTLAFVSDRGGKTNVWLLPLEGGEPRRLTDLAGGPVSCLGWSPDGREIVFEHLRVPKVEEAERKKRANFKHITRLFHKEDGFGWFGEEFWTIWKVDVRTGRATALTAGDHHDREPRWSPDGKWIAFTSARRADRDVHPDLSSVLVMDRQGRRVRELTPRSGWRQAPRWSSDGRHIYWAGYEGGSGEWLHHEHSVWRTPARAGGRSVALNPGHDRWAMNMVGSDTAVSFGTVLEVYREGGEERVAFGSDEEGSYRIYSVSARGGDVRCEIDGKLSVLGLSVAGAGGVAGAPWGVCVAATAADTGELYRARLDGSRRKRRITRLTAPFFRPLRLRRPEEFRVRNGRVELQAWVLKPPGFRAGRRYPCLIEVHGGPMTQYGETWFHEMHVLAAHGWVVAYCNPRGSSGRGMKFCNCIEGRWGTHDWSDVQALTRAMARKRYVDRKRIGILGGSYGGFMTTWAVGHSRRYCAAVTQRQAGDWHVMYGSSDFGFLDHVHFRGKRPWEDPMAYHRMSPNFYVRGIRTPLLVIHSEGDLRCPIGQAEALFTAMKVLGKAPCEMVRFEGEFHGLSRTGSPRNREERLRRIVDWFERYL